jgi:uncharacterized protein
MHINVRDILAEELGYNRSFTIAGEEPILDSVKLTKPIEGEIKISRQETGLLVEGEVKTEIELECHRCLNTFSRPTKVKLAASYSEQPEDDEFPIEDTQIDLAPLVEQEILVNLPIKILCRPDCPGVAEVAEQYTVAQAGKRLGDQARIKKGS